MRLLFVADPAEYAERRDQFVERLAKSFASIDPQLSQILEKALPRKEPELKFKVLRDLHKTTAQAYQKQVQSMLTDIGKVLDQSTKTTLHKSGAVDEVEAWLSQFDWDDLEKAAGHKYARRMVNPHAPPKYKYIYDVASEQTARHFQVGEKISVKHQGKEGHFEVLQVLEGGRLKVRHDESGREAEVSGGFLFELYNASHRGEIQRRLQDKRNRIHEQFARDGLTEGYKKYLRKRMDQIQKVFKIDAHNTAAATWGVRQEAIGWAKDELHWIIDQYRDVQTEVELEAWTGMLNEVWDQVRNGVIWQVVGGDQPFHKTTTKPEAGASSQSQNEYNAHVEYMKVEKWIGQFTNDLRAAQRGSGKWAPANPGGYGWGTDMDKADKLTRATKAQATKAINRLEEAIFWAKAAERDSMLARESQQDPVVETIREPEYKILVHRNGREDFTDADVKAVMDGLRRGAHQIRQAGFGAALQDLELHLRFSEPEPHPFEPGNTGGFYRGSGEKTKANVVSSAQAEGRGDIMVNARVFRGPQTLGVIVHEVGHKYNYEQMTPNEQLAWQAEVEKRQVRLSVLDAEEIATALAPGPIPPETSGSVKIMMRALGEDELAKVPSGSQYSIRGKRYVKQSDGRWELPSGVRKESAAVAARAQSAVDDGFRLEFKGKLGRVVDPEMGTHRERITLDNAVAKIRALGTQKAKAAASWMERMNWRGGLDTEFGIGDLQKRLMGDVVDHPMIIPWVSWYGGNNEREYFAEAFEQYVTQGPRALPEWTRAFFERLTRGKRKLEKAEGDEPPEPKTDEEKEEEMDYDSEGSPIFDDQGRTPSEAKEEKENPEPGSEPEEEEGEESEKSLTKGGKWAGPKHIPMSGSDAAESLKIGAQAKKSMAPLYQGGESKKPSQGKYGRLRKAPVVADQAGLIGAVNEARLQDQMRYEKVRQALQGYGYTEADFEDGGRLYGMSTNELIELLKTRED